MNRDLSSDPVMMVFGPLSIALIVSMIVQAFTGTLSSAPDQ